MSYFACSCPRCGLFVNSSTEMLQACQHFAKRTTRLVHVLGESELDRQAFEGMQTPDEFWILQHSSNLPADHVPHEHQTIETVFSEPCADVLYVVRDRHPFLDSHLLSDVVHHLCCSPQLINNLYRVEFAQDGFVGIVVDCILAKSLAIAIIDFTLLRIAEPTEGFLGLKELVGGIWRWVDVRVTFTDDALVGSADFLLACQPVNSKDFVEIQAFCKI
mmetsp:Transcript_89872/g.159899  ORF Transcript_89872/g.159899 Transcript_89872/m.159899 type:complete len:218 (-) Transcript_89872:383-1036(-)